MWKSEYWLVVVGGIAGGVFWYFAQSVAGQANLVFGIEAVIYAMLGGTIAAFINVYTLTDLDASDAKNSGKVIANALIAAVAFPSIISSAVAVREASDAAETKKLEEDAIAESAVIASAASVESKTAAQISSEVNALKRKAESGTLSVETAARIDSDLQKMLDPLKRRAEREKNPEAAAQLTKIIGEIGKDKASTTSKVATEKLAELQESGGAKVKAAASEELQDVTEAYVAKEAIQAVAPAIGRAPVPPPVVNPDSRQSP